MKWVALAVCLAACKERGTISIKLEVPPTCVGANNATQVRLQVVKGGTCASCTTCSCPCDNNRPTTECITNLDCQDQPWCSLGDAKRDGIEFDPPSPGSYALSYHFYDPDGVEIGLVCADVVVESDGTTSSMAMTTSACCS